MSDIIVRLQERRANIWEQAKALLDAAEAEKRDLSGEEETSYRALNADLDKLDERVQEFRAAEQRSRDADAAFAELLAKPAEARAQVGNKSDELRKWLTGETRSRAYEIRPDASTGTNFRTLSKLSAGAGANTVPTSFYNQLVQHMIENSGLLMANPTLLRTATGEQIQVPKTTAHSASASIVAEAGTILANEPTFGQVALDAYKYAFLMQVSHELLNDTGVDLESYLAMQAGRALGNGFGVHLVTGDGSSKPNGVVTAATLGKTGALSVAGAPSGDDLIDLFYSVIAPYRNSQSCAWLVKDSTVATLRKIKDNSGGAGVGNYLWQPGLAGSPDTILGKPVYTDPNVPATATTAKSVLFGDFSAYFVRQVEAIRFERSDDFAFSTDLVTYRAIMRGDGDLIDTTGAIKFFQGGAS